MPDHPRANNSGYVREHVLVAEKALGKPLPATAIVHHVNEVQDDNRNSNLVICESNRYHRLVHARMRIIKAGGHPDEDKICGACKRCCPRRNFSRLQSSTDGLGAYCRECLSAINRDRYVRGLK